jgi:hypothetical protein
VKAAATWSPCAPFNCLHAPKKKKKGFFSLRVVGAAWRRTLRLFALFSTCFELPF